MSVGMQVAMSATIGGTAEALGGGKFANGAVTGAYVMMFNHFGGEMEEIGGPIELPEVVITAEGEYFINEIGEKVWWASVETGSTRSFDGTIVVNVSKSMMSDIAASDYFSGKVDFYSGLDFTIGLSGGFVSLPFLQIAPMVSYGIWGFTGMASTYCYVKSTTYNNMNRLHFRSQTPIMKITTHTISTRGGIFNQHIRRDYYFRRGGLFRSVVN